MSTDTYVAYKVMRKRKDGSLGPILVGLSERYKPGKWYWSRTDLCPPTGLSHRPGFHATPCPPHHLSMNDPSRVLVKVEIRYVDKIQHKGYDTFYVARRMKITEVIK